MRFTVFHTYWRVVVVTQPDETIFTWQPVFGVQGVDDSTVYLTHPKYSVWKTGQYRRRDGILLSLDARRKMARKNTETKYTNHQIYKNPQGTAIDFLYLRVTFESPDHLISHLFYTDSTKTTIILVKIQFCGGLYLNQFVGMQFQS